MRDISEIEIKDFPLIMDYGIHWRSIRVHYTNGIVGTNIMITMDTALNWLQKSKKNIVKIENKGLIYKNDKYIKSDLVSDTVTLTPMEYFKSDLFINDKDVQKELILNSLL